MTSPVNTAQAQGFIPRDTISGRPWQESVRKYFIPSTDGTAVYVGDLVNIVGTSDLSTGCPIVTRSSASQSTAILAGVVVGVDPVLGVAIGSENFNRVYRPASTGMYVLVSDAPDIIYEIQTDATGIDNSCIGANIDIVATAGSTLTGQSGMTLAHTPATTATLPCKIVGFTETLTNVLGSTATTASPYASVKVVLNAHWLGTMFNITAVTPS